MYILNRFQIINSEFVERFCIAEKPDAALIVASYNHERPPVTLGRYRDLKEAEGVLGQIFSAMAGGQSGFDMPESLYSSEEYIKKDARTKRKGGS